MNPLAKLKEKLLVKPTVEDREKVAVVIKGVKTPRKPIDLKTKEKNAEELEEGEVFSEEIIKEKEEKVIKATPLIVDETKKGYDRIALFKKLLESKKLKVTIKPTLEISEEKIYSEPLPLPVIDKRVKKVEIQNPLIIEEDEEEEEEFVMKPKKVQFEEEEEEEFVMKPKKALEEVIPIKAPKKKARITEKLEKGVAILGPETLVEIGDTDLRKRMPKKSPPVIIKVSNYYMNNREIYVNFINSLFEPYRKELAENTNSISCETIGKTSTNFSLLTHQKIVRDYMNLFTPYRGLLLFHGLGSGKTCTSIAIAEGMKDSKKVIVMTPKSLRANYMDELKKCGDAMYKLNQYWEWISIVPNKEKSPVFSAEILSAVLNLSQEYIENKIMYVKP